MMAPTTVSTPRANAVVVVGRQRHVVEPQVDQPADGPARGIRPAGEAHTVGDSGVGRSALGTDPAAVGGGRVHSPNHAGAESLDLDLCHTSTDGYSRFSFTR